jgi:hypothetical protein
MLIGAGAVTRILIAGFAGWGITACCLLSTTSHWSILLGIHALASMTVYEVRAAYKEREKDEEEKKWMFL